MSSAAPVTRSLFGRAWTTFRSLPVWGQVLVWAALWPVLAALYLLSAARPAAWRIAAAAVMLLLVTPVWAIAITSFGGAAPPPVTEFATEPEAEPEPEAGGAPEEPEPEAEAPGGSEQPDPEAEAEPEREPEAAEPSPAPEPETAPDAAGELEVHYLDVGQADATLLLHDEVAILVDAGHWQSSDVVPLLRSRGVDALDLVVVTHPHADHIGQFDRVMDAFPVDEVWWSGSVTTSQTFERAVTALERSDAAYEEPRVGDRTTVGPLTIDVVNPPSGVGSSDLHDAGVGLRVTFGDVRFLFTGDAEAATEARMTSTSAATIAAEVLQLGHHGSRTSTTAPFLSAVAPAVAIYSAGASNQYGHPHGSVIDRLLAADIEVYGTDVDGSIMVTTDGATWSVATEAAGQVMAAAPSSTSTAPPRTASTAPPDPGPSAPSGACTGDQVDINTAGPDELQRIHQIGPERAEQILQLRPFTDVRAMDRISGVGPARLDEILAQGVACVG
jgi:competence protein ComEC